MAKRFHSLPASMICQIVLEPDTTNHCKNLLLNSPISFMRAAPRGEGCSPVRDHEASLRSQFPAPLSLQTGFHPETRPHYTLPGKWPMGHPQSHLHKPWVLTFEELVFTIMRLYSPQWILLSTLSFSTAGTYHKSFTLRRRNNQNNDQQNRHYNHHIHHSRSHQGHNDNQEQQQSYNIFQSFWKPLHSLGQQPQREKRQVKTLQRHQMRHWLDLWFCKSTQS